MNCNNDVGFRLFIMFLVCMHIIVYRYMPCMRFTICYYTRRFLINTKDALTMSPWQQLDSFGGTRIYLHDTQLCHMLMWHLLWRRVISYHVEHFTPCGHISYLVDTFPTMWTHYCHVDTFITLWTHFLPCGHILKKGEVKSNVVKEGNGYFNGG